MAGIRSALLGYNGTASDGGHVRLVNLTTGESRIVYTSCYNGCKGVFGVLRYMVMADSNSLVVCKIGVADATELHRESFAGGFIVLKSDFCVNQLTETSASVCATLLFNGGDYCRVTIEIDCETDSVSTEIFDLRYLCERSTSESLFVYISISMPWRVVRHTLSCS